MACTGQSPIMIPKFPIDIIKHANGQIMTPEVIKSLSNGKYLARGKNLCSRDTLQIKDVFGVCTDTYDYVQFLSFSEIIICVSDSLITIITLN